MAKNKIVAYFYDEEIGNFNYGGGNPMRPHRVRLTHSLVDNYQLGDRMILQRPQKRSEHQISQFHADEYLEFLKRVTPDNQEEFMTQMRRFNLGPVGEADCPVFDGMFDYFQIYSGGSVGGAALMNSGEADICLNWAGGMHHAKKAEASGFCYINDIVLAILELLKTYRRVLYVDIDIHHGDGVEEAFYTTDRVMTVSFHKYGDFFPGTGALADTGHSGGHNYSVNVPLQEGMDDESYCLVFEPVMQKVMDVYQPEAIVMCCGADSLSGDRLGCFNLSLEGHSNCIEFLARFGVPMLLLGGGGYTMRNVARCWCYETGRMLGDDLDDQCALPTLSQVAPGRRYLIPDSALSEYNYYMDTSKLRITVSNMKNANSRAELERIKTTILENLSKLPAAPSVAFESRPPALATEDEGIEEDPDVKGGGRAAEDRRRNIKQDLADDLNGATPEDPRPTSDQLPPIPIKGEGEQKPSNSIPAVGGIVPLSVGAIDPASAPAAIKEADETYVKSISQPSPMPMDIDGAQPASAAAPAENGAAPHAPVKGEPSPSEQAPDPAAPTAGHGLSTGDRRPADSGVPSAQPESKPPSSNT